VNQRAPGAPALGRQDFALLAFDLRQHRRYGVRRFGARLKGSSPRARHDPAQRAVFESGLVQRGLNHFSDNTVAKHHRLRHQVNQAGGGRSGPKKRQPDGARVGSGRRASDGRAARFTVGLFRAAGSRKDRTSTPADSVSTKWVNYVRKRPGRQKARGLGAKASREEMGDEGLEQLKVKIG